LKRPVALGRWLLAQKLPPIRTLLTLAILFVGMAAGSYCNHIIFAHFPSPSVLLAAILSVIFYVVFVLPLMPALFIALWIEKRSGKRRP
jgi:hypothetical protein